MLPRILARSGFSGFGLWAGAEARIRTIGGELFF
jgi:hypothetical protein